MNRRRPGHSTWSRPWLASLAAVLVAACQQGFSWPLSASDPAVPGWRVVERLGEARYLAPSMAGWDPVVPGSLIPAGSQITTGIGGRLIVKRAGDQLSAGTSSRFILPGLEPGAHLHQTAGWLRYRIVDAGSGEFGIETPFLDLVVGDAVLDVTVGDSMTEVAVVSGRVRLRTQDGHRQIDLDAGHSGYASLQGDVLAVRRGPDQKLEKVPPTVIPALHPDRQDRDGAQSAADPKADIEPASIASQTARSGAIPAPMPKPAAAIARPAPDVVDPVSVATPAAPSTMTRTAPSLATFAEDLAVIPAYERTPAPAGVAPLGLVRAAAPSVPIDIVQADGAPSPFDQLTEGLLDGLLPAQPPQARPIGR